MSAEPGSEDEPSNVLACLPDATVVISSAGDIRWGNPAAERALGAPISGWIGRSCLELLHPDDLDAATLALGSVQGKEVGTPIEVRIRTADGWRLAEVIGAPVAGGDGALVLTMRDLTERRRWEVAGDETAKLRALVHNAATLFLLVDASGRVRASSGAVTRTLGHDQADLEGSPITEMVAGPDRGRLAATLDRVLSGAIPTTARVEVRLWNPRRRIAIPYELNIVDLLEDPTVEGLVVSGHDVSERTAMEADLRDALSLLHATLDSTADGVLVVDLDRRITSFNARFQELWHLPPQLLTDSDRAMADYVARQLREPEAFIVGIDQVYEDPDADAFDLLHFMDGRVFERYSTPQRVGGTVVGRVWSFHDITRQKHLEQQLEHQAFHDALTGLANQTLFRDRVGHALSRCSRDGTQIAVLYLDLDDFKRVNDSLGHLAGDDLLVAVSARLEDCVRDGDTVARLGGDEFGLILESFRDRHEVDQITDRIRDSLRAAVRVSARDIVTSVSIGVAYSAPGVGTDQLLRNADLAMYAAKRAHKGSIRIFAPDMHTAALEHIELEGDLRRAVVSDEFDLEYQPIVDLHTGRISGAEALVRWDHPERGRLQPDQFIELAERIGIISDLGSLVLDRACHQAAAWRRAGLGAPSMSVNVSPRQLTSGTIVDQVRDVLQASGLAPGDLVLEITETAMVEDTDTARRTLRRLKGLGVRLALDDFGTGYSSLTHLQDFPIDIIKIDRSFMAGGTHDSALVRAVLRLSGELGLTTIAEGIETADQVGFLVAAGCRLGQGHFFSRPRTAAHVHTQLA